MPYIPPINSIFTSTAEEEGEAKKARGAEDIPPVKPSYGCTGAHMPGWMPYNWTPRQGPETCRGAMQLSGVQGSGGTCETFCGLQETGSWRMCSLQAHVAAS